MNGELRIRFGRLASGPLLAAAGKLNLGTVESLLNVVNAAVSIHGAQALTLDLSQVTYVDVAGVAGLVECRRRALRSGLGFVIAGASRQVLTAARYCRAGELLAIAEQAATPGVTSWRGRQCLSPQLTSARRWAGPSAR